MNNQFKPGDRVNYSMGTDVRPGTVVRVTPTTVQVRKDVFTLDPTWAPEFTAGGFAAHCVNNHEQRWDIREGEGTVLLTFRKRALPKRIREYHKLTEAEAEAAVRYMLPGTTRSPLRHGWAAFHDYNF